MGTQHQAVTGGKGSDAVLLSGCEETNSVYFLLVIGHTLKDSIITSVGSFNDWKQQTSLRRLLKHALPLVYRCTSGVLDRLLEGNGLNFCYL